MKNYHYIVWVGGVADYEGNDINIAQTIYNVWLKLGYDDVMLETIY